MQKIPTKITINCWTRTQFHW